MISSLSANAQLSRSLQSLEMALGPVDDFIDKTTLNLPVLRELTIREGDIYGLCATPDVVAPILQTFSLEGIAIDKPCVLERAFTILARSQRLRTIKIHDAYYKQAAEDEKAIPPAQLDPFLRSACWPLLESFSLNLTHILTPGFVSSFYEAARSARNLGHVQIQLRSLDHPGHKANLLHALPTVHTLTLTPPMFISTHYKGLDNEARERAMLRTAMEQQAPVLLSSTAAAKITLANLTSVDLGIVDDSFFRGVLFPALWTLTLTQTAYISTLDLVLEACPNLANLELHNIAFEKAMTRAWPQLERLSIWRCRKFYNSAAVAVSILSAFPSLNSVVLEGDSTETGFAIVLHPQDETSFLTTGWLEAVVACVERGALRKTRTFHMATVGPDSPFAVWQRLITALPSLVKLQVPRTTNNDTIKDLVTWLSSSGRQFHLSREMMMYRTVEVEYDSDCKSTAAEWRNKDVDEGVYTGLTPLANVNVRSE